MKDTNKFQKFVKATHSLAFWSRELLKLIDKPDDELCQAEQGQKKRSKGG